MSSYQLDLFSNSDSLYTISKPIRLIEFFAGVGFQRLGISKAFPVESWKICEWAIPSILAYDIVHSDPSIKVNVPDEKSVIVDYLLKKGVSIDYNVPAERKQLERYQLDKLQAIYSAIERTHNLVNIMGVKGSDLEITDTDKYEYVLTYSFPCQDLSLAGDKKGMSVSQAEGGTRSGLVWEILRIIKESENKPQLLLMENVPQIHSKDNNGDFYFLQCELQKLGYKNFWQDMNGKNYGIPQNRNRTFMLSIYDKNADYVFPEPEPLNLRLKDLLEESVDEKYYLSEKTLGQISAWNSYENPLDHVLGRESISPTITTRIAESQDGGINASMKVLSDELETTTNLRIKNATAKGYEEATIGDGIDISSRMESHRGTVQKGMAQTLTCQGGNNVGVVVEDNFVGTYDWRETDTFRPTEESRTHIGVDESKCLAARSDNNGVILNQNGNLRIRKLTPLECCRLMGANDSVDHKLKAAGLSDSQRYHIYGDGLIVQIPEKIFRRLKQ